MSWDLTELETDGDWSFVDTLPEGRWSFAFQNIACSVGNGTGVFSGTEHDELHWQPNNTGKGLVEEDGTVHTWTTFGIDEQPWHSQYIQEYGTGPVRALFYLDHNGYAYDITNFGNTLDEASLEEVKRQIVESDSRITVSQGNRWTFARIIEASDGDVLNWDEGLTGKGLIDRHNNVHTWDAEDEWELHRDYELDNHVDGRLWFVIDPDGRIESADMNPLMPDDLDIVADADPRLFGEATVRWKF